jgi:hypothetical protein
MSKAHYLILAFFLFTGLHLIAQTNTSLPVIAKKGKTIRDFIPRGWDTLQTLTLDFNKDGKRDAVLALRSKADTTYTEDIPRILVILAGDSSGYKLSAQSATVLLCRNCGGVFGDPYDGISAEGNVITVSHYGGSSMRWFYRWKFRFQKNDWYLIGRTSGGSFPCNDMVAVESKDENLVTGEVEVITVDEKCEETNNRYKAAKKPLIKLTSFGENDYGN